MRTPLNSRPTRHFGQMPADRPGPHKLAHPGAFVDREPSVHAMSHAPRPRLAAAAFVVERRNAHLAQLIAEPPSFIRQGRVERDKPSLAELVIEKEGISWKV